MLRKLKPRAKDRRDMFMRDPGTGKRIVDAWRNGNFQYRIGLADSLEEALAMVEAYRASVAHLPEPPPPPRLSLAEYNKRQATGFSLGGRVPGDLQR
jgi:hypothetical protein